LQVDFGYLTLHRSSPHADPDELIAMTNVFDHDVRRRSHKLHAGACAAAAAVVAIRRCRKIRAERPGMGAAGMNGTTLCRIAAGLLLCVLAVAYVAPAAAQSSDDERRVALVVGNFGYAHVPQLANPGNDAALIATTLRQLGFTLVGDAAQENVDKAHFDQLVQNFGRAIQGADVAVFYYAGHGMQVGGSNWLVPTDANPTRPQDLEFQMVNADLVLKQMNGAGTRLNLVILDACRNNPFGALGDRAVQGGLAQMRAPEGTMISFATQPGNVAADGTGANGPYATALAASMRKPGLDIFHVFNQVGLAVKHATDGAQQPWESSSPIDGEFYFTQTDAASDTITTAALDVAPATPGDQQGSARGAVPSEASAPSNDTPPTSAGSSTDKVALAKVPTPAPKPGAADTGTAPAPSALQALAEQGKADAQFDLGFAYAKGQGVPRDDVAARHWFALAAAQGVAKAQYWMGFMAERGRGGPRSYAAALQWYRRAADQGFSPAEVAMGRFYGRALGVAHDPAQRNDWYRRAAEHGNPVGEWALGNFYQFGDGMTKDMTQAKQWYERAAAQHFVFAEARLGLLYERGNGVLKDYAESLRWFRPAADAGDPLALNNLGMFYRNGWAVPQDYAQAMRLFRQAADKGSPMAAFNIGMLYANGHGVKADRQQARAWFEKAAAAGNEQAIDRLAQIDRECNAGNGPGGQQRAPGAPAGRQPAGKC
jgi:TPR repeat protein